MQENQLKTTLYAMIDDLAAIEHERWSRWQRYMHDQGELQKDGSLLLPERLVRHWEGQIATPFAALSEDEKDSDREQVRRYLGRIAEALQAADSSP